MTAGITSRFAITTPELVTFHHCPAELPSRARAWLIDQLFVIVLRIATGVALLNFGEIGVAAWLAAMLLIDFGYFTLLEWRWGGQTLGKRAAKIRVVSANGARLTPGDLLLRNLLRPIDSLPFTMVVGGTIAWIDPYRRRLGDLVAGTLVVREKQCELPQSMFDTGKRANVFRDSAAVRARILARVTRQERDLLMDLAQRRDQIDTLPRETLFASAETYFRARFRLPETDHLTAEQAVLNVALVVLDPSR